MSLFNDLDMLGRDDENNTPEVPNDLFAKYLLSPAYFAETEDMLLVKLFTAKGDPFFIVDRDKALHKSVCGLQQAYLAKYDPDLECEDSCAGFPKVTILEECALEPLMSVVSCKGFDGIALVCNTSVQLSLGDCSPSVFRVAVDKEGNIRANAEELPPTCTYPVPYPVVNLCSLSKCTDNITSANVELIDKFCQYQYKTLHDGEELPDRLDDTLMNFMGIHSNTVKGLLDLQNEDCNDAQVRKDRKENIDNLSRLMLKQVELVQKLQNCLKEMENINSQLEEYSLPVEPPCEDEDCPSPTGSGSVCSR